MVLKYKKIPSDGYDTVKQVINNEFNISYNLLVKLKKNKRIFLNGNATYIDKEIHDGDEISLIIDFKEDSSNIVSTKMDLTIL